VRESTSRPECPERGSTCASCQAHCKCEYDKNREECDNNVQCFQIASLENQACIGNCLTDNQTREVEVVDTDSKEKVISIIQFPYKSATRLDTLEEMRAERKAGISLENLPITIEMNGVSVTAGNDEWTSDKARDHRSKIRRAASNTFMERLERLRPILGARGELGTVCRFLIALILNHEACRGPVTFEPAKPDCQFDASFRYGCSEAQKRKVAAAKSGGKVLTTY